MHGKTCQSPNGGGQMNVKNKKYVWKNQWVNWKLFLLNVSLQWNLSKANTLGTNIFVRFKQVSALDRLCLWDFKQGENSFVRFRQVSL